MAPHLERGRVAEVRPASEWFGPGIGVGIAGSAGGGDSHPVEGHAVFAKFSGRYGKTPSEQGLDLYNFIGGGARLMCSWKTTPEDVAALVRDAS